VRRARALLAILSGACGSAPPAPGAADAPPDCSQARAEPVVAGTTLAFLAGRSTVSTWQVIASTGCWALLHEAPASASIAGLAVDPGGRYLYASGRVDAGHTGIEAFRIDAARGRLEPIGRFPLERDFFETPADVVATSSSVYTITRPIGTGYHGGGVWRFALDPATGWLTWRDQAYPVREPGFLEWSPARSHLFVWTEDRTVGPPYVWLRALRAGPAGELSLGGETVAEWGQAESDPGGEWLWMAHDDYGGPFFQTLDVFAVDPQGRLTRTAAAPWGRTAPAAHASGRVLYARSPGRLESFAVDRATGRPSPVTSVARGGPDAARVAVDPSGAFVTVVSADEARAYRTDEAGSLREIGPVARGGGPVALVTVR
jgi:6-phosphogluconolactonase (cycloisomerase 2 family)